MRVLAVGAVTAIGAIAAVAALASPLEHGGRSDACGEERWTVKTLTDTDAAAVDFAQPKASSVEALRHLNTKGKQSNGKPPKRLTKTTPRVAPVETTVYKVPALLMSMKREKDKDIHMVIADPKVGGSMIVEFPATECTVGASEDARLKMQQAREDLATACGGEPGKAFTTLKGTATISGVGFFDLVHGQGGVAPNGIELHPVLRVTDITCSRAKA